MSQPHSQHYLWGNPTRSFLNLLQKLLTWHASCLFGFFWFSLSFAAVVYGMLLLLLYDDGTPRLIFTASLPRDTYTSYYKHTHHSCCAVSWLATFWAYVPHGALSSQCSVWKLLISTLSPISALCSAMARANRGRITLLDDRTTCFHPVVSQRLWPVIHHKTHHK